VRYARVRFALVDLLVVLAGCMVSEGERAAPGPPATPPPEAMRSADSVRAMLLARRRSAPARTETPQLEVVTCIDSLERELAATKAELECAETDRTQLEMRVEELVDDKAQLYVRLSAALADIRALESELSAASLKDYLARLDKKTGGKHSEVDMAGLRRENLKLKASLKKLRGQPAGRDQYSRERVVAAEAKSKQLVAEVESLKRRLRFLDGASREATRVQGKKNQMHQRAAADRAPASRRGSLVTDLPSQQTREVVNKRAVQKPVWK
jgi:chromosome segregation ATPase